MIQAMDLLYMTLTVLEILTLELSRTFFGANLSFNEINGSSKWPTEPRLGRGKNWGRATHICVGELTIIGSDNGLSPGQCQAIIWTNAGILLIRTLATNLSEILGKIHSFSFKKMRLKMSSAKGRLFSLGLNELKHGSYCNIEKLCV